MFESFHTAAALLTALCLAVLCFRGVLRLVWLMGIAISWLFSLFLLRFGTAVPTGVCCLSLPSIFILIRGSQEVQFQASEVGKQ